MSIGGIIIIKEIEKSWRERPVQVLFAVLILWVTAVIIVMAGELIIIYVSIIIALLLFIGGLLLSFSIKPRECKSAAWMTGIAFLLLWIFLGDIKALEISFLNATDILEIIGIAFMLMAILEAKLEEVNITKVYKYVTLAFFFIVFVILSN